MYVILLLFFHYEKDILQIFLGEQFPLLAGRWNKPGCPFFLKKKKREKINGLRRMKAYFWSLKITNFTTAITFLNKIRFGISKVEIRSTVTKRIADFFWRVWFQSYRASFKVKDRNMLLSWCFTAIRHFWGYFERGQLTYRIPHCSLASLLGSVLVLLHILSPVTDNCPSWISGRERMAVEIIS